MVLSLGHNLSFGCYAVSLQSHCQGQVLQLGTHTESVQQGVLLKALLQILVWLFTHSVATDIYCRELK